MLTQASVITAAEAQTLFSDLISAPALVLAVSGGPDSTALMVLAARWRGALKSGPKLIAVTVDHGLRKESKREAAGVARLAKRLSIAHRTLRWTGRKPKAGLPQAARTARYHLLAEAARRAGSTHVLTAHTLDDQAETVLIRLLRGSGLTGLAAMQRISVMTDNGGLSLVRPLLDIPKARLVATLCASKIPFAEDPTNRDPTFTRARLRGLMPQLAGEGLDARRLAVLARRLGRADAALAATTAAAKDLIMVKSTRDAVAYDGIEYDLTPDEVALRLLGQAISAVGDEGPVELAKLEALKTALDAAKIAGKPFRRSLAGAIVTLIDNSSSGKIVIERAPPRRSGRPKVLTKDRPGSAKRPKTR